ncbi:MAG: hypothetical protein ACRENP_27435 [Longimicrobiales bacterium]
MPYCCVPCQLFFLNAAGTRGLNGHRPIRICSACARNRARFPELAAFELPAANLVIDGRAEKLSAHFVPGSCFELLGLRPQLVWLLIDADEHLAPAVAMISHG